MDTKDMALAVPAPGLRPVGAEPAAQSQAEPLVPSAVKSEPSYADGYFVAARGGRFDTDRAGDEPYCYGFEAGDRARKLFLGNGFQAESDGSFSIRLPVLASAMSGSAQDAQRLDPKDASAVRDSADAPVQS